MEQVTVKMTPDNSTNPVINKTTSDTTLNLIDVAHDTYTLDITSDVYKPYSTTLVVNGDTTLDIHLEALVTQQIEWRPMETVTTVPITTNYTDDSTLNLGVEIVDSEGTEGTTTVTWEAEYIDGVATGTKRNEQTTTVPMVQRQVRRGTLAVINIADRGAVYNDPTHDNKPLLHDVMEELHANGGGIVEFPSDKGVLYTSADIYVSSGITLQGVGDRPIIKLMPSVDEYWSMFHFDDKQDINMYNLTVDTNKTEREAVGNLGDLSTHNRAQVVISMGNDSANINISNNKIIGNGVWVISCHTGHAHPNNISITENDIFWSMGYSTQNADLPQGVTIDNTWVYFDAVDYEFIGNTLNSDTPSANMTAIEAHGADGVVRGNSVTNARTGIIPWNIVNDTTDRVINDILVEENEFIDVLNGVDIGLTPNFNFTNLIVRGNNIELNPNNFPGAIFSRGIIVGSWSAVNGEISENFTIENNYISSKPFEINHVDNNDNFEYYYNYYGIGVISGVYKNLKIQNNTISDLPSFGIMIQNEYQKQVIIESGTVVDNIVENVMKSQTNRSPLVGSALHIMQRADTIVSGLTFGVNYIVDTRSTVDTWYDTPTTLPNTPNIAEQEVSETKDVPEDEVVFDSRNETISFTMNSANNYLNSFPITLEPNTEYYLESDYPDVLWITNNLENPMLIEVWGETSQVLTTSSSGIFAVVASPPVDLDGTTYEYNTTQFEDKTYSFTIRKVT